MNTTEKCDCGEFAVTLFNNKWLCYKCFNKTTGVSEKPTDHANEAPASDHYRSSIEPIDYILANNMGFLEGNVIKYVTRYKNKNGLEDLKKAQWYLNKLIEETEQ